MSKIVSIKGDYIIKKQKLNKMINNFKKRNIDVFYFDSIKKLESNIMD